MFAGHPGMEKTEEELQAVNRTGEQIVNLNSVGRHIIWGNRFSESINKLLVAQKNVFSHPKCWHCHCQASDFLHLLSSPNCTPQLSVSLKAKLPVKLISGWDYLMKEMWGKMT